MDHNEVHFIEDDRQRRLYYRFSPSAFISNFNPLLIILDDASGIDTMHFEYKMWNVLTPLDCYTSEEINIDDIGHKDDLLQKLIDDIAKQYECEEHIYLYGRGSGVYGAILHGLMCQANAIYSPMPQIQAHQKDSFRSLFKKKLSDKHSPIIYLCKHGTDDETVNYFLGLCSEHDIKIDVDYCPKADESKEATLKEVLHFFERMISGL